MYVHRWKPTKLPRKLVRNGKKPSAEIGAAEAAPELLIHGVGVETTVIQTADEAVLVEAAVEAEAAATAGPDPLLAIVNSGTGMGSAVGFEIATFLAEARPLTVAGGLAMSGARAVGGDDRPINRLLGLLQLPQPRRSLGAKVQAPPTTTTVVPATDWSVLRRDEAVLGRGRRHRHGGRRVTDLYRRAGVLPAAVVLVRLLQAEDHARRSVDATRIHAARPRRAEGATLHRRGVRVSRRTPDRQAAALALEHAIQGGGPRYPTWAGVDAGAHSAKTKVMARGASPVAQGLDARFDSHAAAAAGAALQARTATPADGVHTPHLYLFLR